MENDQTPPPASTAPPELAARELTPGVVPAAEKQWGLFSHLSAFSGFIVPLGSILGPLIMWQIKKDQMPFGAEQAKEAFNFNLSILIYGIVAFLLIFVAIGIVLLPVVGFFWLVMTIIAAIKANEGVNYRYPLTIRFV